MKSPHPNEIVYAYMFIIYFFYRSISHIRLHHILSLAFMNSSYWVFSSLLVLGNATCHGQIRLEMPHVRDPHPITMHKDINILHVLRNPAIRISFNFIDSSIPNMFKHKLLFSILTPTTFPRNKNAPCNTLEEMLIYCDMT